jgi:hypothetical protein
MHMYARILIPSSVTMTQQDFDACCHVIVTTAGKARTGVQHPADECLSTRSNMCIERRPEQLDPRKLMHLHSSTCLPTLCINMYIYIYIYIHTQTHIHTCISGWYTVVSTTSTPTLMHSLVRCCEHLAAWPNRLSMHLSCFLQRSFKWGVHNLSVYVYTKTLWMYTTVHVWI